MSFQSCIPHFDTGGYESHASFVSDETYGLMLDNITKGCSDLLLVHPDGKKIFVGKRNVHPQPDWWLVGGRMLPGETAVESCRRLLKRELTLDIHPNRFNAVCCQTMAWHLRQQEPKHHGTTELEVVLSFQVKEEELSKVVFDRNEYDEVKWVDAGEILKGNYHPALKHPVHCLLTKLKLEQLERIVYSDADNKDSIAKAAKEFIQSKNECNLLLLHEQKDGQSAYKLKNDKMGYEAKVSVKAQGIGDE